MPEKSEKNLPNEMQKEQSHKEQRIRNITQLYYSRPDIQKAVFDFSANREVVPRYFEGFGKRPDSLQYPADILAMVKKGATSFHCSEELWSEPMKLSTDLNEKQLNELRTGWDLLIDIDCKWFDYSKLAAEAVIEVLNNHKLDNVGVKFSGSKGWHIIIPWKTFPKRVGEKDTKNLFPELPRIIIKYIRFEAEKILKKKLPNDFFEQFKGVKIKKGIKCSKCNEIATEYVLTEFFCDRCNIGEERKLQKDISQEFKCPNCGREFSKKTSKSFYECNKCNLNSKNNPTNFIENRIETDLFELMGLDLILVSPRHLFRMPYSLHEKTSLASVVIDSDKISDFQLSDADPLKAKIKNFIPVCKEGEASELLMQALDWYKEQNQGLANSINKEKKFESDFKPIKLEKLSDRNFPPCVQNMLKGLEDGQHRSLFALINLFRSVGMEKEELEKRIEEWNKKNNPQLKQGYIKSQLIWSYRKKPIMPPNCREFYQGIGVCQPDNFCNKVKNPINYVIRKQLQDDNLTHKKTKIFKNNT